MSQYSSIAYPHQALTSRIIGAFYVVYNELGPGFAEAVYESALDKSLAEAGIHVERQCSLNVWFHNRRVGRYRADMLVEGLVVLELKAVYAIHPKHVHQLLNLLRSTGIEVGLLLNFGPRPKVKRLICSRRHTQEPAD
jgi:GxxExxY protein